MITLIGSTAAVLTTIAFLPQTIKTLKTRRTKDISLPMYLTVVVGIAMWAIYGYLKNDSPLLIANLISFFFAFPTLILKLKYG